MKYLKTYKLFESINLDDYEDFISKWKKSGGYISRNTVKKMDEIGIKHEYFSKVKNDIDRCYSFFGKNDIELLSDLMLEAFDEVPSNLLFTIAKILLFFDITTITSIFFITE